MDPNLFSRRLYFLRPLNCCCGFAALTAFLPSKIEIRRPAAAAGMRARRLRTPVSLERQHEQSESLSGEERPYLQISVVRFVPRITLSATLPNQKRSRPCRP